MIENTEEVPDVNSSMNKILKFLFGQYEALIRILLTDSPDISNHKDSKKVFIGYIHLDYFALSKIRPLEPRWQNTRPYSLLFLIILILKKNLCFGLKNSK